ncbi:MAG: homing endonuclease associated repeat-containing protein [Candidatus Heritagella sp.]
MKREEKREQAIRFLREKERQLGRCPKRHDFSGADAGWIKQILGPWPRALEAAGLKEAPSRKKSHPRRAQQPFAQEHEKTDDGKEAETK